MSDIISFLAKKFPLGTYAMHKKYNYCRVIKIEEDGMNCLVKVARQGPRGNIFKIYEAKLTELEEIVFRLMDHLTGGLLEIPMDDAPENN